MENKKQYIERGTSSGELYDDPSAALRHEPGGNRVYAMNVNSCIPPSLFSLPRQSPGIFPPDPPLYVGG